MTTIPAFHEVRFPTDISLGAAGGPVRRTEVVTLGSGQEQRNTRWANSRRRYNAGYGIKTIADLQYVVSFFEERRGRLHGFRFRDPLDWSSAQSGRLTSSLDQVIGTGDGQQTVFQLKKQYGGAETGYSRKISKPVEDSVKVSVNGGALNTVDFSIDLTTGEINCNLPPALDAVVTAGFEFDLPVRFDTDEITINMSHFEAGDIPSIPMVELLI